MAAVVFKEKGFASATLNDIASRLDTDRASLYYYVGSKDELLEEIVRGVLTGNVAAAEKVAAHDATGAEKIRRLIVEMMMSFDRNYPHMYVYIEDFARISRRESFWAPDILASTRRFEEIVVSMLEQGRADGSLRTDLANDLSSLALFGIVNWTHRWYKPGSQHSPEEIAGTLSAIFLHGYACPPGHRPD